MVDACNGSACRPQRTLPTLPHVPTLLTPIPNSRRYRMRYRNFLVFKPLVLLSSLGLERGLCQQTCSAMPGQQLPTPCPCCLCGRPDDCPTAQSGNTMCVWWLPGMRSSAALRRCRHRNYF